MNHSMTYSDFDRKFCYVFDVLWQSDANLKKSFIVHDVQYLQQIFNTIALSPAKYNFEQYSDQRISSSERLETLLQLLHKKKKLLILKHIITSELYLSFCDDWKILVMY